MRLTRRDDGSRGAAAAPPGALAGADLRLPPGVADAPIPADFNLPDAFFAGAAPPAPPMPPFGGTFTPFAGAPEVETAAPVDAPVDVPGAAPPPDDFFGHGAASPADVFLGADAAPGGFFGEDDDEPADDFFRGSASAPMSAVPPPPDVLYAESGRPAAPPNATPLGAPSATARAGRPAVRRPLPSVAVLAIGALALACLTLLAALVMTASDTSPAAASAPDEVEVVADAAEAAPASPAATSAAGGGEGSSVSADELAALEAAANLPLTGELTAFLAAAEASFGATSAQLDPALRPYAYRLASRFEWNPDTFRISVVAPDAALAQSRVDVLKQVFSDAVASGRLVLVPATGPSALTLVAA